MLKFYNGQYKNEKTLIKFNMVRYTTMCIVLDYFCFMNSVESDVACTLDHLIGLVFNKSSFDDTEENRTMVQTTIINMKMMGLLYAHTQDTLAITNQGKQAYIDQTYHLATANLFQANASRRLSVIAIGVAVVSIILSLIFQILNVWH